MVRRGAPRRKGRRRWSIRRWLAVVVAVPLVGFGLFAGGVWVWINVIREPPPEKLSLKTLDEARAAASASAATAGSTPSSVGNVGRDAALAGQWIVAPSSVAGYRVKEVLFGQDAVAVGRTNVVSGSVTVAGSTVTAAEITVDLTKVTSDDSRRDRQFQGRIMNTAEFPLAIFTLTAPTELGSIPADGVEVKTTATGALSLHGVEKTITIDMRVRRKGTDFDIVGSLTVVFADYEIPNPSNVAASTGDDGVLEFALLLRKG